MLVCKMGQDGHDRGAKVVATAFADVGFDIDLSPMFSTPEEVARQAIENDVHVVGAVVTGRRAQDPGAAVDRGAEKAGRRRYRGDRRRRYPQAGLRFLYKAGVKCIFGPGTPIPSAARDVLDAVKKAQD